MPKIAPRPDSEFSLGIPGRVVAVPSFVIPGTVAENCRFLSGRVEEVGLCLFEWETCLAYDDQDLSKDMTDMGLAYHAHLPLYLPWEKKAAHVFGIVRRVIARIDYLAPRAFVLHPPEEPGRLEGFLDQWDKAGLDPGLLLLENIHGNDLVREMPLIRERGCGLCLDMGHILAYGQERLLAEPGVMERVRMLHLYAPKRTSGHAGLDRLDSAGLKLLRQLVCEAPEDAVLMLEVFSWAKLEASLPILAEALGHGL